MIAVIADDFTGAAELAGIGLRYGLKIQLAMPGVMYDDADLFVVATDSRSLNSEEAMKITGEVVRDILTLQPELIYKKIDSVLRGHVLDELNVQMQLTGLNKAFLLPANPSLNRTIRDGAYYINGTAISETGFAADPEFAITDSSVLKMIRAAGEERILKQPDSLPAEGIVIGEAETMEEVAAWADKVNKEWVLAGAGDFFTALLSKRYEPSAQPVVQLELPHLYVSGTAFDKSRVFIRKVKEDAGCVAYLPGTMIQDSDDEIWLSNVSELLAEQGRCVIAIDENEVTGVSAQELRNAMAKTVKKIIERENIQELFIEGGSTAAAILSELSIVSLIPVNELQRGVVRMKAGDLYITVKPGSYELPGEIRNLYLQ